MAAFDGAATLEHVEEAGQVCIDIGVRIDQRIAHTGLRREMHHIGELMRGEQLGHFGTICDIERLEAKRRKAAQLGEPRLLERGIVVVIEIVDPDDRASLLEQAARHMEPDESRRSGHQYLRTVLHAHSSLAIP